MNYVQLGKEISYVLRHHPEKYNLDIDNEGWVDVGDLLNALESRFGLLKKEENIYKCLSDYVIPVSEERTDYVGAFVVTAGAGADCLKDKFEEEGDTYNSMLLQTLTDRLAEATAEYLHEKVRKEYWGYAKDESLSIPDLYKVKYQGIRPAIGYPSLPDQLLNFTL